MLRGRVNVVLEETERDLPFIEFSPSSAGGYLITVPEVRLTMGERTEKDRIVRLDVYTLTITFTVPEDGGERNCYVYARAAGRALKENPTLDGAADRAFLFRKEYRAPKRAGMGEPWEVVLTLWTLPRKSRPRKGLQRKARRICMGKSEDLQRKARFFTPRDCQAIPGGKKCAL
jgi:hypothetical protein